MNWINKILLAVALAPSRLYAHWGVDIRLLRTILTMKLVIDDRSPNSIQKSRQYQSESMNNATVGRMIISLVMGMGIALVVFFGNKYFEIQMVMLFSLLIVMICLLLISDFTSVLIDVKDNEIILPKPVNDATIVVSRLLHVFVHLFKIVLPMCLPSMIYLSITVHAIAGFVFLIVSFFTTLFAIFLINALYIFILKITTPARFKNIISYIQIGFIIAIYGGMQLLPRLMTNSGIGNPALANSAWLLLAPPYWFASLFSLCINWQVSNMQLLASVMAVVVPLLSVLAVVKFLAPAFNQKMAMISGGGTAPGLSGEGQFQGRLALVSSVLAQPLVAFPRVHIGFLFSWKMIARSRDFKLKVYPMIGYFFVMFVPLIYNSYLLGADTFFKRFFTGFDAVSVVYMSGLALVFAILHMPYSEKFKAAWLFYVPPIELPGQVIVGAVLAIISQFCLFPVAFLAVFGLMYGSLEILLHLLLAFCNIGIIAFSLTAFLSEKIPFSHPQPSTEKSGQLLWMFAIMTIGGILVGMHYLAFQHPIVSFIALAFSILGLWLLIRRQANRSWEDLAVDAGLLP